MKTILLIGSTGQVGTELLREGASSGFEIHGVSRQELDVRDTSAVRDKIEKISPDIVVNTAAFHVTPLCEERPLDAFELNSVVVANLAAFCKELDISFVTYSTDYVFDGTKGSPYVEDDPPHPLQMYGISKLAGEYAAQNRHPKKSYIIRTCVVYGGAEGSPNRGGNFVLNLLGSPSDKLLEYSSEQIIIPTSAHDLAQATLKLLSLESAGGIYHLVNEGKCSPYEFAREIIGLAGTKHRVRGVKRRAESGPILRPIFSALSNQKAKGLGIILPSWQDAVAKYIEELRGYGKI